MKVTKEQAQNIIWEDEEDWELVYDNIEDTSRWSEFHEIVCLHKPTGKYYMSSYSQGLTECQDESPWDYDEPKFTQCWPKEVTVTQYTKEKPE